MGKLSGKRTVKEALLYTLSSAAATVIDYATYFFVLDILHVDSVNVAFTSARVVSAVINFLTNNYFVFRQRGKPGLVKRAVGYAGLAGLVALLGNGIILLLHSVFGLSELVSKLVTDCSVFLVSYFGQKLFIFRHRHAQTENSPHSS